MPVGQDQKTAVADFIFKIGQNKNTLCKMSFNIDRNSLA
jgi:hypothetical protein